MPTSSLEPSGAGTWGPSNWSPSGQPTIWQALKYTGSGLIYAPAPANPAYVSVALDNLDSTAGGVTGNPDARSYYTFGNSTISHGFRLAGVNSLVSNVCVVPVTKTDSISRPGGGKWSVADINAVELVENKTAAGDLRPYWSRCDVTWTKAAGGCIEGIFNLILPVLGAAPTLLDLARIRRFLVPLHGTRFTDEEWQQEVRCILSHSYRSFHFGALSCHSRR